MAHSNCNVLAGGKCELMFSNTSSTATSDIQSYELICAKRQYKSSATAKYNNPIYKCSLIVKSDSLSVTLASAFWKNPLSWANPGLTTARWMDDIPLQCTFSRHSYMAVRANPLTSVTCSLKWLTSVTVPERVTDRTLGCIDTKARLHKSVNWAEASTDKC